MPGAREPATLVGDRDAALAVALDGSDTGSTVDALAHRIAGALVARGETLSTVECTLGGAIGAALTEVAGASAWFVASVAPYSAGSKATLLGLEAFGLAGTVSLEAALALARAGQARLGSTWVLAETGIAGPRGGRRSAKEPGQAYLALVGAHGARFERALATGLDDRHANRAAFLRGALELLARAVTQTAP